MKKNMIVIFCALLLCTCLAEQSHSCNEHSIITFGGVDELVE